MFMKRIILLLSCLILSDVAFAAMQLQALVDNNQVALGETINLTLALSDPTTRDQQQLHEPNLSTLETDFIIHSSNRTSSYQIVNGQASQQIRWQYVIEPQKMGQFTIPSLTLKTSTGELRSQPIKIQVTNANTQRKDGVYLEAIVTNTTPYLYQPIHYTLRLYHRGEIRDVEPLPPDDGVLLERLTDIQNRRQVVNGQQRIISEVTYLLTPIRSGELNLTARMKGLKAEGRDNFSFGFSMGFANYRPVTVSSTPLNLTVQPPANQKVAWLPLNNLNITQKWETDITQAISAGTPIIRTVTIMAEGMGGQTFPDLEALIPTSNDFRLRTPKPETERSLLADRVTPATKITQTFSLIPIKTGELHLPALRIPWWDVNNQVQKWAEIPAQIINVIENQSLAAHPIPISEAAPVAAPTVIQSVVNFSQSQYVSLVVALSALLFALIYSWYMRLRPAAKVEPKNSAPQKMSDSTFKRHLKELQSEQEIKQLIQTYAHLRWLLPENMSLSSIAHYLKQHYVEGESMADSLKKLDAALYGQQNLELPDWKQRCSLALDCLKKKKVVSTSNQINVQQLNPV